MSFFLTKKLIQKKTHTTKTTPDPVPNAFITKKSGGNSHGPWLPVSFHRVTMPHLPTAILAMFFFLSLIFPGLGT